MTSIFTTPVSVAPATAVPRPVAEVERAAPSQTRDAPGGAPFGAADQGAGRPAGTGTTNEPTAIAPEPAAAPAPSPSQTARVTEAEVQAQARQGEAAANTDEPPAPEPDVADKVVARRESLPIAREEDPARTAAESYRDANETTSGAEPAQLMMTA